MSLSSLSYLRLLPPLYRSPSFFSLSTSSLNLHMPKPHFYPPLHAKKSPSFARAYRKANYDNFRARVPIHVKEKPKFFPFFHILPAPSPHHQITQPDIFRCSDAPATLLDLPSEQDMWSSAALCSFAEPRNRFGGGGGADAALRPPPSPPPWSLFP